MRKIHESLEEKVVIYLWEEREDLQATGNVWAEP